MAKDEALHAVTVLLRAAKSLEELLKRDMQPYGLNATEFAVLEMLFHKGEQPIQLIAKKILVASGSVTYVIDQLEKKGYVLRKPSPTDRRVTFACLTMEGEALMADIFPKHRVQMDHLFQDIPPQQLGQLIEQLKHIGYAAENK